MGQNGWFSFYVSILSLPIFPLEAMDPNGMLIKFQSSLYMTSLEYPNAEMHTGEKKKSMGETTFMLYTHTKVHIYA